MAAAVKRKFSASVDGQGILIAANSSPGTLIHTAVAGTTDGTYDEIWLWAYNQDTSTLVMYIEWGNAGLARIAQIDARQGWVPVIPGLILQNSKTLKIYAQTSNLLMVDGFVNSITD